MVIRMEKVVKRFKDLVALDHFDLAVEEGQVYGLLGPNGSGKSTAINCMLALLNIDKGEVEIFGRRMRPTSYQLKRDIGLVPQEVAVMDGLTVQENIDYFCGLYVSDHRLRKQLVSEAIDFCGLEKFRKFIPQKLSGGLRRRLNIACGIAHKPRLLILDEPTVAVDPQSRNSILEGIQRLNSQGTTVLYTSHYMEEVEQICSMITIMDKGKAVLTGTRDELKASVGLGDKVSMQLLACKAEDIEAISQLPFVSRCEMVEGELRLDIKRGEAKLAALVNFLEDRQLAIGDMQLRQPTLNDVFLEVTGKELRDGV